jgi:hypothetical protein
MPRPGSILICHPALALSGGAAGDVAGGDDADGCDRDCLPELHGDKKPPQCQGMLNLTDLASVACDPPVPFTDRLRLAVAAYLARFKGSSREHTESDLRCYLAWCAEHGLDALAAQRWVCGKGAKVMLVPLPPAVGRGIDRAVGPRARGPILLNIRGTGWTGTRPPAAFTGLPKAQASRSPGRTRTCCATHSSRPCWTLALTCMTCRSPPGTPTRVPPCVTTGPARTWTATQLHPRRLHGFRHLVPARVSRGSKRGTRPTLPMSALHLVSNLFGRYPTVTNTGSCLRTYFVLSCTYARRTALTRSLPFGSTA